MRGIGISNKLLKAEGILLKAEGPWDEQLLLDLARELTFSDAFSAVPAAPTGGDAQPVPFRKQFQVFGAYVAQCSRIRGQPLVIAANRGPCFSNSRLGWSRALF
mgnify:CR=1 FL=1